MHVLLVHFIVAPHHSLTPPTTLLLHYIREYTHTKSKAQPQTHKLFLNLFCSLCPACLFLFIFILLASIPHLSNKYPCTSHTN
uniref:Uncharacterized protein n=1 Tax=Picea glauca TaxID=3330 RepID=A0A101LUW4_PICGL|nr:hypothetical protein ABT39_MTgene2346 [Picea glauca]QHR92280.1 hypothetical protein Q903MT_gene6321 [Picea sitchensis]